MNLYYNRKISPPQILEMNKLNNISKADRILINKVSLMLRESCTPHGRGS